MTMDLIIRNALLAGVGANHQTMDIGICDGAIVALEPHLAAQAAEHDAHGKLVSPGLVESHFHLDKALTAERTPIQPERMVRDHMQRTASIKHTFTAEDVYARARDCLEQCLLHGVTHMRTQVAVDPNCGLIGFVAIEQLRKDYA
ncbi:MAG: cytosine deaminase [Gammaproteobacteria bacterium]|jgi:cytosine deaminase